MTSEKSVPSYSLGLRPQPLLGQPTFRGRYCPHVRAITNTYYRLLHYNYQIIIISSFVPQTAYFGLRVQSHAHTCTLGWLLGDCISEITADIPRNQKPMLQDWRRLYTLQTMSAESARRKRDGHARLDTTLRLIKFCFTQAVELQSVHKSSE